jgi:hypothetical protein
MYRTLAHVSLTAWLIVLISCACGSEDAPEPPPPPDPGQQPMAGQTGQPGMPGPAEMPGPAGMPGQPVMPGQPGQQVSGQMATSGEQPGQPQTVNVTLTANSEPAGAQVLTAAGQLLGTTPLVSQIQLPANQAGLPMTFTFNLAGYQPTTATAVAINNAVTVQAALQPVSGAMPGMPGMPSGGPRNITVHGTGGGAISDFRTTTARAMVNQPCIVQAMSIRVNGRHSYHADLVVSLRGPAGQSAQLQRRRSANPFRTYTINRAIGTQAMGQWRLIVRDELRADSGVLSGFTMNITCQ